jgi:hypothetical protein
MRSLAPPARANGVLKHVLRIQLPYGRICVANPPTFSHSFHGHRTD